MRILLANTAHFYGGGDSTYTFNLSELLRDKGHAIAFFAMHDERNLRDPNEDLFVSHINFKEINRKKSIASGLRVAWRVIYSKEAASKFSQIVKRFRPDVVHLQNIHAHITPSIISIAKDLCLPVLWTLHDYKIICPNSHFLIDRTCTICEACNDSRYYKAIVKRCKKGSLLASAMVMIEAYAHRIMKVRDKVDYFLAPSAFLKKKLIERGFQDNKVKHLPLFLPNRRFYEFDEDKGYMLFVGRITPIKGIYPLLKACQVLQKVRLVLVGPFEKEYIHQFLSMLPVNAEYVGMKHGEDLWRLIKGARAIVTPSLCYENQPFSITEAFAASKPVIASDLGGMRELVNESEGGLLVPPHDAHALAEAMIWMTLHPKEAKNMGKKAHEYARRIHSSELHYHKLMRIYQHV